MAVLIPEDLLLLVKKSSETEIHPPGSKVFTQGEDASHFFIVAKGRVRVYSVSPNGKERTIEVLDKGRIFGDSSFLTESKRNVNIEAVIKSEIICCRSEDMIEICSKSKRLMNLIFQHMADTCNYLTHQIVRGSHYNSEQKVADFLLTESNIRQQNILPYTHEEIAASTSLNRVTVSRIVSKFKEEKIVDVKYGRIEIWDKAALEKLLPDT